MTCNPYWLDIQNALLSSQIEDDKLDLRDRVLRMMLKILLKHLKGHEPFGKLAAFVSVIEL